MTKEFSRQHETELRAHPPRVPVRLATDEDELGVIELFKMMHAEQPYHRMSLPKVAAMIRLATHQGPERRGIIGVIGPAHDLKAGVFLLMEQPWYSEEWFLAEYFTYVRLEYRRFSFAGDLIGYAKACSNSLNMDLSVGVFSNIRTEAKCRLYRRWMPKIGEFFLHVPPSRQPLMDRIAGLRIAAE